MTYSTNPPLPLVDLSSCDREPIHIPGAIQPHGLLLAVEGSDLTIVQVSANCEHWLQQAPAQLLGRPLASLLTADSMPALAQCLAEGAATTSSPRLLRLAATDHELTAFSMTVHRSGEVAIVELEPQPTSALPADQAATTFLGDCRQANRRLGQCQNVTELCQATARELHALTGYDRILVYQFDEEWNGAVVAEHCLESLEPYLGLHYPASDIPAQARAIFLLNGLRLIPDVQYRPAPLVPQANPRTGQPLDLSRAHLRSVSPIHLEYLRNMGVSASLTISLVVDDKLWGLIACHHLAPRYLPPLQREACELFGQMVAMQLTHRLHAARQQETAQATVVLGHLTKRIQQFDSIVPPLLAEQENLLALTSAQGAVLWNDGEALPIGATPPLDSLPQLQQWVAAATTESVFYTDRLPQQFPAAEAYADVASGLLALVLARAPDVYLLWFRPEVIRTVNWAGDPSKSIETGSADGRLRPRQSFARWQESVRYRSLPWLNGELEAARQLRSLLQDQLARLSETLRRLMPICAWCKKVRSDQNYWQQVDEYIGQNSDIRFTHGICPDCAAVQMSRLRRPDGTNGVS